MLPVSLLALALLTSAAATWVGVAVGLAARYSAAAPPTCGAAIEVPLMVLVAVLLPIQAPVMLTPGPKMSTQVPVSEKLALVSLIWLAATVMALGVLAGELRQ